MLFRPAFVPIFLLEIHFLNELILPMFLLLYLDIDNTSLLSPLRTSPYCLLPPFLSICYTTLMAKNTNDTPRTAPTLSVLVTAFSIDYNPPWSPGMPFLCNNTSNTPRSALAMLYNNTHIVYERNSTTLVSSPSFLAIRPLLVNAGRLLWYWRR